MFTVRKSQVPVVVPNGTTGAAGPSSLGLSGPFSFVQRKERSGPRPPKGLCLVGVFDGAAPPQNGCAMPKIVCRLAVQEKRFFAKFRSSRLAFGWKRNRGGRLSLLNS